MSVKLRTEQIRNFEIGPIKGASSTPAPAEGGSETISLSTPLGPQKAQPAPVSEANAKMIRERSAQAMDQITRSAAALVSAGAVGNLTSEQLGQLKARLSYATRQLAYGADVGMGALSPEQAQIVRELGQALEQSCTKLEYTDRKRSRLMHEAASLCRILAPASILGAGATKGPSFAERPELAPRKIFDTWREKFASAPTETAAEFAQAHGLTRSTEEVEALLRSLLFGRTSFRAFTKATRTWAYEKAAKEAGVEAHLPRPDVRRTGRVTKPEHIKPFTLSTDGKVRSVAIVGQGPIGLLAAVLTKADPQNRNTNIVLIDKRGDEGQMEYSRPIKLAVRHEFLSLLDSARPVGGGKSALDLLRERGQVSWMTAKPEAINLGTGEKKTFDLPNKGQPSKHRVVIDANQMLGDVSVALVETRHIEQALRDVAKKMPGIDFLNGYEVSLTASDQPAIDGKVAFNLATERMAKVDGKWTKTGEMVSLGTPDMIFAADGTQSRTVRDAGIGLRTGGELGRYVAGTVTVPEGPNQMRKISLPTEDGGHALVYANIAGEKKEAWMIAELPKDWSDAQLKDRGLVQQRFRAMVGQSLGIAPDQLQIQWGGDASFKLMPSAAKEPGRGNFMPIGDASGNNHFTVGGGTVGGAQEAFAAALMITQRNVAPTPETAAEIHTRGLRDAYRIAMAWHLHGPEQAQQELGIRELMQQHRATTPRWQGGR